MFLLLQLLCFAYVAFGRTLPNTVDELSVASYLGKWYQVYGSPTNTIFQGYGECITAEYGLLEDGDVSVLNTQINENNEVESINGYAYYKDLSKQGQLTVHLNGVPIDSAYWVVKLGEIVNDEYQYSIITTPSGISLWVLARDVDTFFTKYNDEVVEFLTKYNFYYTLINQMNCDYKYNIFSKNSKILYIRREALTYEEGDVHPCCNTCDEGLTKYYSISNVLGNCGETCLESSKYPIYKLFEPGLTYSSSDTICKDLGFKNYVKTETHGIWPVTATVDMYKRSDLTTSDCPEGTSSCEYLPGSYQCCPSNEYCIPNVGCRC